MVGMVEPTLPLAPEAREDFKADAATMHANPMVVLLNSGCSHHLMGTKEVFVDMAPIGDVKHVRGFNGAQQTVKGRGTVTLHKEAGQQILIPDVLYVPSMQANLLSAGQLQESGVKLQDDGDEMMLMSSADKVRRRARYTGRVLCTDLRPYSTKPSSKSIEVVALRTITSATKSTPDRWHGRLAHVGVDTIKSLAKKEVATGLDIKPSIGSNLPYVSCVGGKLAQHTFSYDGSNAKEPLAVVHIDLCGPFWVASKDHSLYFLLLKDRHTRFTKKSVLMLRSDRGGGFMAKEFTNFVDGKGIVHDLTFVYTPQQNGMTEREMRTVVDAEQMMLLHMGVQHHWWHHALRQAV
ncbi:unnamed protein product [Closterium sp. NIES-53]